jgi:hypothetical protein
MSQENLEEELARLRAENEALKTKTSRSGQLWMKVSSKGALSLYGLGRFPVTLYLEQWERVLNYSDDIKKFIEANREQLKTKG